MLRTLILLALVLAPASAARAEEGTAQFALVVGSNAGGPGQATLRYAQEDAKRMGAFLTELGGYAAGNVDVLLAPTPDLVRQRLDALATRVQSELAAGKPARVMFYYSGHARATALDLGTAQLPLSELRTRLFTVPAQVTVVVLDACQSGAFSRVKGASPAADFSFNSRSQLDASGVAVLASSTGSELSQESETLRSSYFTHHLLVGMRGAGDTDRDGQVSIDEAYRYAYHQTLLATAETAVGGQHVTFEVDLKGHGQVPMSFPRAATSSITLPAGLEGKTYVEDIRARAIVLETNKSKGAPVRIAIAPGEYRVLVRSGELLSRCKVTAGPGGADLDLTRCTTEKVVASTTKGFEAELRDSLELHADTYNRPWRFELSYAGGTEREDGYTRTLQTFGYAAIEDDSDTIALTLVKKLTRNLWVGGSAVVLDGAKWTRTDELSSLEIDWTSYAALATAEGLLPLGRDGFSSRFAFYANVGLGLSLGRTEFTDQAGEMTERSTEWFVGPALSAGAGLRMELKSLRGVGFLLGYQLQYQRAIDNLTGDTHAAGGNYAHVGVSLNL